MKKARPSSLYAHAHNALLAFFAQAVKPEDKVPPKPRLARACDASITTVHRILLRLEKDGLLSRKKGRLHLRRLPRQDDYLPEPKTLSRRDQVEQNLIEMFVNGRFDAGQSFSELSLARQQGVTTGTIREALLNLKRLGLFQKEARKQWRMIEIDHEIVNDLMDLRILLETFALKRYFSRSRDPSVALEFRRIQGSMLQASRQKPPSVEDFIRLDRELHQTILAGANNRQLLEYSQTISFPIQFQFLRHAFNAELLGQGTAEHLRLLRAINADEADAAIERLEEHLEHARMTLLGLSGRAIPPTRGASAAQS